LKLVFEDIDKPNGVDGTVEFGLIYWEYEDTCDKISVQQIEDDIQKCFYLVEPTGGVNRILESGFEFTRNMSETILKHIQNGKCFLVISSMSEGYLENNHLKKIHEVLDSKKIPPKQVIFIQSNYNLENQYKYVCDRYNIKDSINLITTQHKLETSVESYRNLINENWNYNEYPQRPSINLWEDVKEIRGNLRDYYYLSYNKTLRPDRVVLLSLLLKNNLIKKGLVSIGSKEYGSTGKQNWPDEFDFIDEKLDEVEEWSNKLKRLQPLSVDGEPSVDSMDEGKYKGLNVCGYTYGEQFRRVYFMVVTEDVFNSESMFFSQTTYKPIVSLTPFIMFGSPYMMKNLREVQGFKTFSPWIDESYDEEENHEKRLYMIVDEIKRLCNIPRKEMNEWYYEMKDILIHNQKHLLNFEYSDFKRIERVL